MKFTILLIRVFLLVSATLFLAFSNASEQLSQSKNQIFAEVVEMDEAPRVLVVRK